MAQRNTTIRIGTLTYNLNVQPSRGFQLGFYYNSFKKRETRNLLSGTFLQEFTAGDSMTQDFSAPNHHDNCRAQSFRFIQLNLMKFRFLLRKRKSNLFHKQNFTFLFNILSTTCFKPPWSFQFQKHLCPRKEESKIPRGLEFCLL